MCRRDRGISAKSADIWLSGRHVADMAASFSAKVVCNDVDNTMLGDDTFLGNDATLGDNALLGDDATLGDDIRN